MSRYIDADKLKEKLDSFILMDETPMNYNCGYDDCLTAVQDTLADIPTADVVEVVRCKDCKYFEVYYPIKEKDKEPIKAHYCKLYNSDRKQIDFCSYGERKDIK